MNRKALLLLLPLAACAPPLPKPNTDVAVKAYLPRQTVAASPVPDAWWGIFGNPSLNALEAKGQAANPDVGQAEQNLAAAAQNAVAANGAFLPQIGLNPAGSPALSRQSYPTGPNSSPPYTVYTLSGQISYDPGLFGARHYTFENGQALTEYQAAELDAARQSVAGNIAAAAIGLAGAEAQIATTQDIIAAEQKLLTLLQGEYAAGAIPELNVLQQQAVILAAQATLPPLQNQAQAQRDRLAILAGTLPADFTDPGILLDQLAVPAKIPMVLPSAYLANRPDIRAARAQVAEQNAALGIAVAHMYPDVSLTASGGYAAESLGMLFNTSSALWTLAGNLLVPIYEGGELRAHKKAAQAELASALYAYRGAVLGAFGQAADALSSVQTGQITLARAQAAASTADAAYSLAAAQYALGAVDYTTVLTAQANAAQAALTQTQARTNLLLAIASLQAAMAK
jgi:NodT family efflux transporter outer membrane factor (OMF) lipoprotein